MKVLVFALGLTAAAGQVLAADKCATLKLGEVPPAVTLEGEHGGHLDGKPWSSEALKNGKVQVMFYVDPDERDTNDATSQALKKEGFAAEVFHSTAVINFGATWLPDFVLASKLAETQKEYPLTTYVKDINKGVVKAWKVADDSSDILLFDRNGKLLFCRNGKLTDAETSELIALIKQNLAGH